MQSPSRLLFLPGALGRTGFRRPVAELLTCPAQKEHVAWPGFNGTPGGGHDVACAFASQVAPLIDRHLIDRHLSGRHLPAH